MERRSRSEWRRICAASYASGLTVREFAACEGVNPRTLSWWRWELRDEAMKAEGRCFVELVGADDARSEIVTGAMVVRIGEVVVELASLPPAEWLAELASRC